MLCLFLVKPCIRPKSKPKKKKTATSSKVDTSSVGLLEDLLGDSVDHEQPFSERTSTVVTHVATKIP